MAMTPHLPPDGKFEQELRKQHLQQLRNVGIPDDHQHLPTMPWPLPPGRGGPSPYEQLVDWSKQAKEQITKAVSNRVVSPEQVDWNNELFTLLESAAVYLRDTSKVFEAVEQCRKRTKEGDERALQLLYDSQADIKKIAAMWGLDFEVICDLLQYSPEGYPLLNGPYCGVFFSKDTKNPFLGLAFKGTNPLSWSEVLKDLKFAMMMAAGNILWGSPIHRGFYQTMFLKFPHIEAVPLDFIKNMIDMFLQTYPVPPGLTIDLHTTGHSLGGAYATLCYAELMRLYNNDPTWFAEDGEDAHAHLRVAFSALKERQFVLRDLYTFGCPRLGGVMDNKDWARSYVSALKHHDGRSWHVKNGGDPVTNVPPVVPLISTWNHVDSGYKLDTGKAPVALPTEVGTQPSFGFNPLLFQRHSTGRYFENLYNASTTGPKIKVEWLPEDPENFEEGEVTAENAGEYAEGAEL
ncbi:Alpha/Beta hydrolase protein [Daedaleopsis nitida]|nr:Alpha/Beta hydrolase protein [Daedaleopsis nitida]